MSTKTVYPPPPTFDDQLKQESEVETTDECVPIQLNYVIRHGTRHPTIKDIRKINATHAKLNTSSRADSWISSWTSRYRDEEEAWLAPAGVTELVGLGQRLRARFGASMGIQFHADKFVVEHTWKERTQQSASAFAHGFFHGPQPVFMSAAPAGQDEILRFYDNCLAFEVQVEKNKSALVEHTKYRDSHAMRRNLRKFRQAANDPTLLQKDMEAAYSACAFDVATHGILDEWCSLFDVESLLSLDYLNDLKHFYRKGHGNAIAYEIASPLLQHVAQTMESRVRGDTSVEGHFRFAHAETILPLASLLNLSSLDIHQSRLDGHFRADTPLEVALKRKFKGSELAPFSANIGFVLYDCHDGFKVQTLLHERQVTFDACGNEPLCPFEEFKDMFRTWLFEYDFQTQCQVPFEK